MPIGGRASRSRPRTDRAARHLTTALREQGLAVDWPGDPGERIRVRISDWRKPLPV